MVGVGSTVVVVVPGYVRCVGIAVIVFELVPVIHSECMLVNLSLRTVRKRSNIQFRFNYLWCSGWWSFQAWRCEGF